MYAAASRLLNGVASVRVDTDYIRLLGGLDEVTPPYELKPGRVRYSQNFEASINGGYRRIDGYERYDGQPRPSDAVYSRMDVTITGAFAVGNTVTGATSGATGKVLAVVTSVTPNYLVMTKITGTFQAAETLNVAGSPQGTSITAAIASSASTPALHAAYRNLAADEYRNDIAAVPGAGPIRGVVYHGGSLYAFRNNVGNTAAALYRSSSSGWVNVPLGRELSFTSGGTTEIAEGDTITGATSGATAVVTRVVLTSGTWAAGTAAGKVIFASQTGTFQAENLNIGASLNVATIAGNSSAITLLPDGRFRMVRENFGGAVNTKRVYGVDGVNRGFEFDGTVFVPIDTGMTTDTPDQVGVFKKHLFFAFGGSVQHSSPGTPYVWSPITGASEIAMGDDVTGFYAQPGSSDGGAMAIFTRNRTSILYGSGVSDWNLVAYRDELGAYEDTIQDVGFTVYLDDRGITDLQTSQEYGNFTHNAISDDIRTSINSLRKTATASCISRDLNQYRLFFSSGYAIYVTVANRRVVGMMKILTPDVVRCIWSGEEDDGGEGIYFGSDEGVVYQMNKGTSFDGDAIEFYLYLPYNFQKSPRIEKHYRAASLEIQGSSYAEFNFGYTLGYGSSDIPQPTTESITTNFAAVYWDSFTWDAFYWDGITLSPNTVTLDGDAENISMSIAGNSDIFDPFTVTAALIHYTARRRLRP